MRRSKKVICKKKVSLKPEDCHGDSIQDKNSFKVLNEGWDVLKGEGTNPKQFLDKICHYCNN